MQISIWYPADAGENAERIRYGEYFHAAASEVDFGKATASEGMRHEEAVKAGLLRGGADAGRVNHLFNSKTLAVRDAEPLQGKFPVIFYEPSYSASPSQNSVMFEYLASHGFVIAAVPSMGAEYRFAHVGNRGVEAQGRDLEFVMGRMRQFPNADCSRVGVIGYSFGGLTNVIFAFRNINVKAYVSLDGGIGTNEWREFLESFPYTKPEDFTAAFMYLASSRGGSNDFYEGISQADAYWIGFPGLGHGHFCSEFCKTAELSPSTMTEGIEEGYETICRYVLNFMEAYINGDEASMVFLTTEPKNHGITEGLIHIERKKGVPELSAAQLISILVNEGVETAATLHEEWKVEHPKAEILETGLLNALNYHMSNSGRYEDVIRLSELITTEHPDDYESFYYMGLAYDALGDRETALQKLRRALEIKPDAAWIESEVKRLEAELRNQ